MLNIFFALVSLHAYLGIAKEIYVSSEPKPDCLGSDPCGDGSLEQPFKSLLEALDFAFSYKGDVRLNLVDPVYNLSKEAFLEFEAKGKRNGFNFSRNDSLNNTITLKGEVNFFDIENAEAANSKIVFNGGIFSILTFSQTIEFSNIDIVFERNFNIDWFNLSFLVIGKVPKTQTYPVLIFKNVSILVHQNSLQKNKSEAFLLIDNENSYVSFLNVDIYLEKNSPFNKFINASSKNSKSLKEKGLIRFEASVITSRGVFSQIPSIFNSIVLEIVNCRFRKEFLMLFFELNNSEIIIRNTSFLLEREEGFSLFGENSFFKINASQMTIVGVDVGEDTFNEEILSIIFLYARDGCKISVSSLTFHNIFIREIFSLVTRNQFIATDFIVSRIAKKVLSAKENNIVFINTGVVTYSGRNAIIIQDDGQGSLFYLDKNNHFVLENVCFTNNFGISIYSMTKNDNIKLIGLIIFNCTSVSYNPKAGFIYIYESHESIVVADCAFISNQKGYVLTFHRNHLNIEVRNLLFYQNEGPGIFAMYMENQIITIENLAFTKNAGEAESIFLAYLKNEDVQVSHCYFLENTGKQEGGGVIYLGGENLKWILTDCLFIKNMAHNWGGGAIYIEENSLNISIEFSIFISNFAKTSGGAFFLNFNNQYFTVSESIFLSNVANLWDGGVLYMGVENSHVTLKNLSFLLNTAFYGGNIYLEELNFLDVVNCGFKGGEAKFGGLLFSLKSNVIHIEFSLIESFSTILGMIMYVGSDSEILVNTTVFDKFRPPLKNCPFFRLHGSRSNITITFTLFKGIYDYLYEDMGFEKRISISDSFFNISDGYAQSEIFRPNLNSSSLELSRNTFKINSADVNYFIYSLQTSSNITLKNNIIENIKMVSLVTLTENGGNFINITLMSFKILEGNIIQTSKGSYNGLTIFLSRCSFFINGTRDHYFLFESGANITIRNTNFYIGNLQTKGIIYLAGKPFSILLLINGEFKALSSETSKFEPYPSANPDSHFGIIHSEEAIKELTINGSIFMVGQKSFRGILSVNDCYNITIEKAKFLFNVLRPISYFFFVKYDKGQNIQIVDCLIKNNKVVYGGLLTFEINSNDITSQPKIIIKNNTFINNRIVNKGGLFYINATNVETEITDKISLLLESVNFSNNILRKNKAALANLLYIESPFITNADFSFAKAFGEKLGLSNKSESLLGASLNGLNLYIPESHKLDSSKYYLTYKIFNKRKLLPRYFFCVSFHDKYNQTIAVPYENEFNASIIKTPGITFLAYNKFELLVNFTFFRGLYCAYRFYFPFNFQSLMGNRYSLDFNPASFLPHVLIFNSSLLQSIRIDFDIDDCKAGELFNGETCISCPRNSYFEKKIEGSLSLCYSCNELNIFNCYGGNMRSPKPKHWRFDNESDNFLKCPASSCLGDLDFEKNLTLADCTNCYLPGSQKESLVYSYYEKNSAIGYCKKGYTGVLCTECFGSFGATERFECGDCTDYFLYLKQGIKLAIKLFLFFFSNWKALKSKILDKTDFGDVLFIDNIRSSYLLKILFIYFNYCTLLLSLPIDIDPVFRELFVSSSNISPSEDFEIFSFECLLRRANIKTAPIYVKAVVTVLFMGFSFLGLTIAVIRYKEKAFNFLKYLKTFKTFFIGILILFSTDNMVLILTPLFRLLFCINVSDTNKPEMRLLSSLVLQCWDKAHKNFVTLLVLPLVLVVAIIIPLYIFYNIFKAKLKKRLKNTHFLSNFGYFVAPFRDKLAFYEMIRIFNKICLIIFKEFFVLFVIMNKQLLVNLFFLFYLLVILAVQTFSLPYNTEKFKLLQKIDDYSLKISVSNALTAIIWGMLDEINKDSGPTLLKIVLFCYVSLSNFLFLLLWFQSYFGFLKGKFQNFFKISTKIKTKLQSLFSKKIGGSSVVTKTKLVHLCTKSKKGSEANDISKQIRDLKILNRLLLDHIRRSEQGSGSGQEGENEEGPCLNYKNVNETKTFKICEEPFKIDKKHTSDLIQGVKRDIQTLERIESRDSPYKFKLVSKKLKGKSFDDYFLSLKYEPDLHIFDEMGEEVPEFLIRVDDNDWIASVVYENKLVSIVLRKLKFWNYEKSTKQLAFTISIYSKNSPGISTRILLNINLIDFFSMDSIEWVLDSTLRKSDLKTIYTPNNGKLTKFYRSLTRDTSKPATGQAVLNIPIMNIHNQRIRVLLFNEKLGFECFFCEGTNPGLEELIRDFVFDWLSKEDFVQARIMEDTSA